MIISEEELNSIGLTKDIRNNFEKAYKKASIEEKKSLLNWANQNLKKMAQSDNPTYRYLAKRLKKLHDNPEEFTLIQDQSGDRFFAHTMGKREEEDIYRPHPWKEVAQSLCKESLHLPIIKFPILIDTSIEEPFKDFNPPFDVFLIHSDNHVFFIQYTDVTEEMIKECEPDEETKALKPRLYEEWKSATPCKVFYVCYLCSINQHGEILSTIFKINPDGTLREPDESTKGATFPSVNEDKILLWAKRFLNLFYLINCKNVILEKTITGKIKRKREKDIELNYYELRINNKLIKAKRINERIKSDLVYRQHWCRGHFKQRKSGRYWWSPHIRGSEEVGKIIKSYNAYEVRK